MPGTEQIVRYAIHPAVGIARVGNAQTEFFLAPEFPGQVATPPYKDAAGAVKRQVARFRIFGFDQDGTAVREITADEAQIEWRVHLANRKAGWYQFNNPMDLGAYAFETTHRNASILEPERKNLIIDTGSRTISGRSQPPAAFDTGRFMGEAVYLGELRTDDLGRLLVFGGRGASASAGSMGGPATTFANNDGWHDDVADGPVRATLRIGGQTFEAEPAVVVVAPPNFAHGLYAVVTLYDVVEDLFASRHGGGRVHAGVSFWRDVYPIFERTVRIQWVNEGAYFLFGANSPGDLTAAGLLAELADPSPASAATRQRVFEWFRDPTATVSTPARLPVFYGDGQSDFVGLPIDALAVTPTQYNRLRRWAAGDFSNAAVNPAGVPASSSDCPVADQPHALDRAALEECLGGPFHPGIELTWVMRHPGLWSAPFRLRVAPEGQEVQDDYGLILRPDVCLGPRGPLHSSGPGTLTRWMGVPWQTDEASCLSGYDASTYLPLPTFWAVRVPNQVLSQGAYARLMDERLPLAQRMKHFDYRQFWLRDLGASYQQRINGMIEHWHDVGIVAARPGPSDARDSSLPEQMWVETERSERFSGADATWQQIQMTEGVLEPLATETDDVLRTALQTALPPNVPIQHRRRLYTRGER